MDFYTQMAERYDEIFKFSEAKFDFLRRGLPDGGSILDIGCGTGTYSVPFAMTGYEVLATDLDDGMLERAALTYERTDDSGSGTTRHRVLRMNLTQLGELSSSGVIDGRFDLIYCIGNTLPHVSHSEAALFIKEAYALLKTGGRLIIQTVNYDHALKILREKGVMEFKKVAFGDGMTFERRYRLGQIDDSIIFEAAFAGDTEKVLGETKLHPVTQQLLVKWLKSAGFDHFEVTGDFSEIPFDLESPALVAVAIK